MSDNANIYAIFESTYNVTPTAGDWFEIVKSNDRFTGSPQSQVTTISRPDGQPADQVRLGFDATGGFDSVLKAQVYDSLFEAGFRGTWTADSLNMGIIDRSLSVEKVFPSYTNAFFLSSGGRVNGGTLTWNYGSEALITFDIPCAGFTAPLATAVNGGNTIVAAVDNPALGTTTDIGQILVDGAPVGFCIDQLSFEWSWNMATVNCLGQEQKSNMKSQNLYFRGTGRASLSDGMIGFYRDKVLGFANTAIVLPTNDGVRTMTFTLPRVKISGDAPLSSNNNAIVQMPFTFEASYDPTSSTTANILRGTV